MTHKDTQDTMWVRESHSKDYLSNYQANTTCWTSVVLMLAQRLRRRANNKTTLAECFVFAVWGYFLQLWGENSSNNSELPVDENMTKLPGI